MTSGYLVKSYSNLLVAGKYHLRPDRAVELRLGLEGRTSTSESTGQSESEPRDSERPSYAYGVLIGLHYLSYRNPLRELTPFIGVGPDFHWSHGYSKQEYSGPLSDTTEYHNKQIRTVTSLSAGIMGRIGFEWFPAKRIALVAEYDVALNYLWSKSRIDTHNYRQGQDPEIVDDHSESKSSSVSLDYNTMQLGIALYF